MLRAMNDSSFFDVHSLSDPLNPPRRPTRCCGAIAHGGGETFVGSLRAGALNCIVGPNDPRYPSNADIIDLTMDDATLLQLVKQPPSQWWPLCGNPRTAGHPVVLHVNACEYNSIAKGLSRIARYYPNLRILIDPFKGGKASKWQAGLCLADEPNIWITTHGLFNAHAAWPDRSEREALYCTIGEVGAGKLLFASGMTPAELDACPESPAAWLASVPFLESAQSELILRKNATELFAAFATESTMERV